MFSPIIDVNSSISNYPLAAQAFFRRLSMLIRLINDYPSAAQAFLRRLLILIKSINQRLSFGSGGVFAPLSEHRREEDRSLRRLLQRKGRPRKSRLLRLLWHALLIDQSINRSIDHITSQFPLTENLCIISWIEQ